MLIVVSMFTLVFVLRKIRKSGLKIDYSLFWIVLSVLLFITSIFPVIPIKLAELIGIMSPVNFIYLMMIFVLIIHGFYLTVKTSQLEDKIQRLTEEIAIKNAMKRENKENKNGD